MRQYIPFDVDMVNDSHEKITESMMGCFVFLLLRHAVNGFIIEQVQEQFKDAAECGWKKTFEQSGTSGLMYIKIQKYPTKRSKRNIDLMEDYSHAKRRKVNKMPGCNYLD